ncbi:MAG: LuxR C-terminal-related transcriptional regulator [Bilophila wadsworthia]
MPRATATKTSPPLNLSVKTIDTHRTSFMKKLDLHNVREVTRFAMQNGLVGDGID